MALVYRLTQEDIDMGLKQMIWMASKAGEVAGYARALSHGWRRAKTALKGGIGELAD